MKIQNTVFKTCKEQGEWAELCFMAKAAGMGLKVLRPFGDSSSYDVGVELPDRILRVQVKSTGARGAGTHSYASPSPGLEEATIRQRHDRFLCCLSDPARHLVHPSVRSDGEERKPTFHSWIKARETCEIPGGLGLVEGPSPHSSRKYFRNSQVRFRRDYPDLTLPQEMTMNPFFARGYRACVRGSEDNVEQTRAFRNTQ